MNVYKSIGIFLLIMFAILASALLKPDLERETKEIPDFKEIVPNSFGDWEMVENNYEPISVVIEDERERDQPYDAVLMETFQSTSGNTVMVAIAYGANQQQEIKIHRPELCYPAQGFKVEELNELEYEVRLSDDLYRFNLVKMVSQSKHRRELTLYWIRIGDIVSSNPWEIRWHILKGGLSKKIPDGILVRTSQVLNKNLDIEQSIKFQKEFIQELLTAISEKKSSDFSLFIPESTKI